MFEEKKANIFQKLAGSRQALLTLLEDLDESQWDLVVYSEDAEWTVRDLFSHIMVSEKSMTRLVEVIQEGGEGASEDFDLKRWNARTVQKSSDKLPEDIRAEMIVNRGHLLELLDSMPDSDWEKKGRHGSLRIMTVEEILRLIADHECDHMNDISHVLVAD